MTDDETDLESGVPEVKVPAAVDAGGMLRFKLSVEQAHQVYDELESAYENDKEEDAVPLRFVMDRETYTVMADGLSELQNGLPRVGVKQIPLTPDPAYALTVVVNANQISHAITATNEALDEAGNEDTYSQEFRLTNKGAVLVLRQLEQAFDGATDPVEAIDMQKIRSNHS